LYAVAVDYSYESVSPEAIPLAASGCATADGGYVYATNVADTVGIRSRRCQRREVRRAGHQRADPQLAA